MPMTDGLSGENKQFYLSDLSLCTFSLFLKRCVMQLLMNPVDQEKRTTVIPASILYKSIAGLCRPVSYPDGPITARYRFIKNAYWDGLKRNEYTFRGGNFV